MNWPVGDIYAVLGIASEILLILVLGLAIFFWGRGIRNGRDSDLIAGPAILVALIVIGFVLSQNSAVFGVIGTALTIFGLATVLLSRLARPGSRFSKQSLVTFGVIVIIVGVCLSCII